MSVSRTMSGGKGRGSRGKEIVEGIDQWIVVERECIDQWIVVEREGRIAYRLMEYLIRNLNIVNYWKIKLK